VFHNACTIDAPFALPAAVAAMFLFYDTVLFVLMAVKGVQSCMFLQFKLVEGAQ
jgi:hypothetical protein